MVACNCEAAPQGLSFFLKKNWLMGSRRTQRKRSPWERESTWNRTRISALSLLASTAISITTRFNTQLYAFAKTKIVNSLPQTATQSLT